jgi:hypothetical protein
VPLKSAHEQDCAGVSFEDDAGSRAARSNGPTRMTLEQDTAWRQWRRTEVDPIQGESQPFTSWRKIDKCLFPDDAQEIFGGGNSRQQNAVPDMTLWQDNMMLSLTYGDGNVQVLQPWQDLATSSDYYQSHSPYTTPQAGSDFAAHSVDGRSDVSNPPFYQQPTPQRQHRFSLSTSVDTPSLIENSEDSFNDTGPLDPTSPPQVAAQSRFFSAQSAGSISGVEANAAEMLDEPTGDVQAESDYELGFSAYTVIGVDPRVEKFDTNMSGIVQDAGYGLAITDQNAEASTTTSGTETYLPSEQHSYLHQPVQPQQYDDTGYERQELQQPEHHRQQVDYHRQGQQTQNQHFDQHEQYEYAQGQNGQGRYGQIGQEYQEQQELQEEQQYGGNSHSYTHDDQESYDHHQYTGNSGDEGYYQ